MLQGQTMGRGSRTARHNNRDVRVRHKQSHHLHPVLKNSSVLGCFFFTDMWPSIFFPPRSDKSNATPNATSQKYLVAT